MLNRTALKGVFLSAVLFFCHSQAAFCHPREWQHIQDILKVLFGKTAWGNYNDNYENSYKPDQRLRQDTESHRKLNALMAALWLGIDETANETDRLEGKLSILRTFGVSNLPLPAEFATPGGSYHQRYSHRGWMYGIYQTKDYNEKWRIRKDRILIPTIRKVFTFNSSNNSKIDHFGALLYYVHLLGDYTEGEKSRANDISKDEKREIVGRIPFSGRPNDNWDICRELYSHISTLFADVKGQEHLSKIKRFLNDTKDKSFHQGNAMTDEEFSTLKALAQETLDVLIENIPPLLQGSTFFTRAFN